MRISPVVNFIFFRTTRSGRRRRGEESLILAGLQPGSNCCVQFRKNVLRCPIEKIYAGYCKDGHTSSAFGANNETPRGCHNQPGRMSLDFALPIDDRWLPKAVLC